MFKIVLLFVVFMGLLIAPFLFSLINAAKFADDKMDNLHRKRMQDLKMKSKEGVNYDK